MAALSQAGFNKLKQEEGYKLKAYRLNGEAHCTCCLGHFGSDVQCGRTYTDSECQAFFAKDAARFNRDVNKVFDPATMTQNMFDAMFSFAYNHGNISNTKLGQTIKANPKNFSEIQKVWEASYCSGAYANVLTKRRKREAALYCGSSYSSSALDTVADTSTDSPTWEYEEPTYEDVADAISNVDYNELNRGLDFATNKMDETYEAFDVIRDASNATLGDKPLEINTSKHEGDAEDHALITDASIRSTIAQDEHSAIIKEDTDKSEGYYKVTDGETVASPPASSVTSGFAI